MQCTRRTTQEHPADRLILRPSRHHYRCSPQPVLYGASSKVMMLCEDLSWIPLASLPMQLGWNNTSAHRNRSSSMLKTFFPYEIMFLQNGNGGIGIGSARISGLSTAVRFQSSGFTSSEYTICIPYETFGTVVSHSEPNPEVESGIRSVHGIRGDLLCQHFLTTWDKLRSQFLAAQSLSRHDQTPLFTFRREYFEYADSSDPAQQCFQLGPRLALK